MTKSWLKKLFKPRKSDMGSTLLRGRHTIITGQTGTGKTRLLSKALEKVREYPAVIVDPLGEHLGMLYRSGDHLLNPLDSRSEYWTLWTDIKESQHFEEIARSLVLLPSEKNGPSDSVKAARIMLAMGLEKTSTRSIKDLFLTFQGMLKTGLPELDGFSEAARQMSPDLNPTLMAYGTLLACANHLNCLWLPGPEPEFSLRDWAQAPTGWLFITARLGFHPDLSPLVSTWLEVLSSELLRPEAADQQMFIVIDGLSDLQPLSALQRLLAQQGPHGLTCLTAFRTILDLRYAWGEEAADSFFTRCDNLVSFHADREAHVRLGELVTHITLDYEEWPHAAPRCLPVDSARTYWGPWDSKPIQGEGLH
ncbi:MAG: type IV secretion system DNA-binding domain-containing protein [Candidatus Paceibacterota bacterium]|jgi:hypothetical protein